MGDTATATDLATAATDTPDLDTTDTPDSDTTTARGPLRPRLSPPLLLRLLPIPTTAADTGTPDTATATAAATATAMATATTVKCPSLPAVISTANLGTPLLFKNQVKNGLLQFGFRPPPVPPFQCYQPSLTRNGQQEAPENQNVTIR